MSGGMKDGGHAFPMATPEAIVTDGLGLTKREWFAGMALMGVLANPEMFPTIMGIATERDETPRKTLADICLEYADAMIAEGERIA